jgi:hypothetical protein
MPIKPKTAGEPNITPVIRIGVKTKADNNPIIYKTLYNLYIVYRIK